MSADVKVGSLDLLRDVITKDRELPKGYDDWAIRTVRPDFTSQHGYRYPFPGKVAKAPGPILPHSGACPRVIGDGICAAFTWRGMASGGVPARLLLLVAYRESDVLGRDDLEGKIRLSRFRVVELIDGEALLRDARGANLSGANLSGADLYGANLYGANLYGADLRSADLRSADLRSADLRSADLYGANLYGANLYGADLYGANLYGANLYGGALAHSHWDSTKWQVTDGVIVPKR